MYETLAMRFSPSDMQAGGEVLWRASRAVIRFRWCSADAHSGRVPHPTYERAISTLLLRAGGEKGGFPQGVAGEERARAEARAYQVRKADSLAGMTTKKPLLQEGAVFRGGFVVRGDDDGGGYLVGVVEGEELDAGGGAAGGADGLGG